MGEEETLSEQEKLIKKLKDKHGDIISMSVAGHELYFKKPDMPTMSAVMSKMQADPLQATKLMAVNCLIEGPKEVLEDVSILMSIAPHVNDLIETLEVEVKKC